MASTELHPYDPRWPSLFERERHRLVEALPGFLVLEHFGSTSVPGLEAKPIIDMMAGAASIGEVAEPVMRSLGYREITGHGMAGRRLFRRDLPGADSYHLHVVPAEGLHLRNEILFRDYLRRHPDAAADYAGEKRRAARALTGNDYTRAKTESVQRIVDRARAELGLAPVAVWQE